VSWLERLRSSLGRARESLAGVETLANARRPLDAEFWNELEEILIAADFGVPTTVKILDGLRLVAEAQLWRTSDQAIARFKKDVRSFLTLPDATLSLRSKPGIVLVVGVNGSGKTTTIGKLAHQLRRQRKRVMIVCGVRRNQCGESARERRRFDRHRRTLADEDVLDGRTEEDAARYRARDRPAAG
jgi:fused signal recognition particle receptor